MEWNAIILFSGLLALWSGFIIGVLKWMLEDLRQVFNESNSRVQHLELEMARLKGDIAEKYVAREDWIRFGVTIEAKIDRLGGKFDAAIAR